MSSFNIESLLEFEPAKNWCVNCYALFSKSQIDSMKKEYIYEKNKYFLVCPYCSVKYIPTEDFTVFHIEEFMQQEAGSPFPYTSSDIKNMISQMQRLASIAKNIRSRNEYYPPLRGLFEALLHAKSFVHFTSYGISQFIIGALKVASQNVDIRGIIAGNSYENLICETTDHKNEAPRLTLQWLSKGEYRSQDVPHQKLIVIDGLLAFKGSTNLTQLGWRSAQKDMDILEVVTNVSEVIDFHNRYFSSIWAKLSEREELIMEKDLPF